MESRKGKGRIWIAAIALCLALAVAAMAGFLFFKAEDLPVIIADDGADGPGAALSGFFAGLSGKNWEDASAQSDGGLAGLDQAPEDKYSALLWRAQQAAWSFALAGEYEMNGASLSRGVTVTVPELSRIVLPVHQEVQSLLEQAVDRAALKSDVYDGEGKYRDELVYACLDEALRKTAADLSVYAGTRTLKVKLSWRDGFWKVVPDGELISALTGGAVRAAETYSPGQIAGEYEQYVNNLISSALEGLAAVPKVYRLSESAAVAPRPDPAGYGSSKNAEDAAAAAAAAEPLLAGRKLLWTPETTLLRGTSMDWYLDETIFALCWRQRLNGMGFTMCEVVLGHPSQFRRYIADNSFHSTKRYLPTRMASKVNAVVALSGDFYKYRRLGIVAYQRELFRADGKQLDTCFVDAKGDLLFVRAGELTKEEQIRAYMEEHDVLFSLSFGPVMIEDGQNVVPKGKYPIGQIQETYTRCVLCQLGECHYLLVTVNRPPDSMPGLKRIAEELVALGVPKAYALDGGQTASLILNNRLMNSVDFGEERLMSDIIYFATAMPEGEE